MIFIADLIACSPQTGHTTLSSTPYRQLENQAPNTTGSNHLYNTLEVLMMGIMVPETCWASNKICNKNSSVASSWHFISTVRYIRTQAEHLVHKGNLITISPSYRNLTHLRVTHPGLNVGSRGNPTASPHLSVIPTIQSFALMTSCKDAKLWSCNSWGLKTDSSFRNK